MKVLLWKELCVLILLFERTKLTRNEHGGIALLPHLMQMGVVPVVVI